MSPFDLKVSNGSSIQIVCNALQLSIESKDKLHPFLFILHHGALSPPLKRRCHLPNCFISSVFPASQRATSHLHHPPPTRSPPRDSKLTSSSRHSTARSARVRTTLPNPDSHSRRTSHPFELRRRTAFDRSLCRIDSRRAVCRRNDPIVRRGRRRGVRFGGRIVGWLFLGRSR